MSEWNEALEAAAKLLGREGYVFVRRPLDHQTMTVKVDILPSESTVDGDFDESTQVDPDDMAAAAILSLRRIR